MASFEVKKIIGSDVETDEKVIKEFSRDYSIFEIRPKAVVFPKDVEDIKRLVRFVSEAKKAGERVSLTARSGGTDMTGGPLTDSLLLVFTKYFNRILEVGKDFVRVEPGV